MHHCHLLLASPSKVGKILWSAFAAHQPKLASHPSWYYVQYVFGRALASLYEALTIKTQLNCAKKDKDFVPLWFLYILAALNTLLVWLTKFWI